MGSKLLVILSAVTLACASSIQNNPHIHDSLQDQIAMESGPTRSVVAPPAHLLEAMAKKEASTKPPASTSTTTTTKAPTTSARREQPKPTRRVPSNLFDIITDNEEPRRPQTPPRPSRPAPPLRRPQFSSFGGASLGLSGWRQPQQQPQPQLQMLQLPPRYPQYSQFGGLGAALGGYGGSRTVILLQPIYMPVPVRAAADDDQALAADSSQEERNGFFRQQAQRQQLNLLDLLQQIY